MTFNYLNEYVIFSYSLLSVLTNIIYQQSHFKNPFSLIALYFFCVFTYSLIHLKLIVLSFEIIWFFSSRCALTNWPVTTCLIKLGGYFVIAIVIVGIDSLNNRPEWCIRVVRIQIARAIRT